jgi:predicted HTH domain antitoxin
MADLSFQVNLPSSLSQYGFNQRKVQQQFLEWVVITLFTGGQVSSGKAARLLNLTRVEFLDLLRARGFAYVDYSPEEMADELKSVLTLKIKKSK